MNKKGLMDLSSIIGEVIQTTPAIKEEIQFQTQEIKISTREELKPVAKETVKESKTTVAKDIKKIEYTGEFDIQKIGSFEIMSRLPKVQESFKVKQSTKKIVEDIVAVAKKNKQRLSKGELYNHLIELGLKHVK